MSQTETIQTPQDYVNYTFNIEARGVAEVASELMGLSNTVGNILGQLAFKTSEFLTHTDSLAIGTGLAISAMFTSAAKDAINFQQQIANVQAIGGEAINAQAIGNAAMEYSNKFGMATASMTEGLEALARAGITSTNVMKEVLAEGVKLSKLEGLDLEDSINDLIATTNLLSESGVDMNDANYGKLVQDMNQHIVSTSESAPINAQNIIQSLQHVGGYASASGMDQDDLFAVIAQLGSRGTKGEMAGTALRAFIAAGQKDTAQRALARIGLNVSDLWNDNGETMLSISEMKDVLDDALEARGYSKQEKLEFYSDFAGYKQANQIMKIDTSEVQQYKEQIASAWDLGKKLDVILGTVRGNLDRIWQISQNFMTKVGSQILDVMNAVLTPVRIMLELFTKIPFADKAVAALAIFTAFRTGLMIINKLVPALGGFMSGLTDAKNNARGFRGEWQKTREEIEKAAKILKYVKEGNQQELLTIHEQEHGLSAKHKRQAELDVAGQMYMGSEEYQKSQMHWDYLSSHIQEEILAKYKVNQKEAFKQNYETYVKRGHAFSDRVTSKGIIIEDFSGTNELKAISKYVQWIFELFAKDDWKPPKDVVNNIGGNKGGDGESNQARNKRIEELRAIGDSIASKASSYGDYRWTSSISSMPNPAPFDDIEQLEELKRKVEADIDKKINAYANFLDNKNITIGRNRLKKSLTNSAKTDFGFAFSTYANTSDIKKILESGEYREGTSKITNEQLNIIGRHLGDTRQPIPIDTQLNENERKKIMLKFAETFQNNYDSDNAKLQAILNETQQEWNRTYYNDNIGFFPTQVLKSHQEEAQQIMDLVGVNSIEAVQEHFKDVNLNDDTLNKAVDIMYSNQALVKELVDAEMKYMYENLVRIQNTINQAHNDENSRAKDTPNHVEVIDAFNQTSQDKQNVIKDYILSTIDGVQELQQNDQAVIDAITEQQQYDPFRHEDLAGFRKYIYPFGTDIANYQRFGDNFDIRNIKFWYDTLYGDGGTASFFDDFKESGEMFVEAFEDWMDSDTRWSEFDFDFFDDFWISEHEVDELLFNNMKTRFEELYRAQIDIFARDANDLIASSSGTPMPLRTFRAGRISSPLNGMGIFDAITSTSVDASVANSFWLKSPLERAILDIIVPEGIQGILAVPDILGSGLEHFWENEQEFTIGQNQPYIEISSGEEPLTESMMDFMEQAHGYSMYERPLSQLVLLNDEHMDYITEELDDELNAVAQTMEDKSVLLSNNAESLGDKITKSFIEDGLGRHSPGFMAEAMKAEGIDINIFLDNTIQDIIRKTNTVQDILRDFNREDFNNTAAMQTAQLDHQQSNLNATSRQLQAYELFVATFGKDMSNQERGLEPAISQKYIDFFVAHMYEGSSPYLMKYQDVFADLLMDIEGVTAENIDDVILEVFSTYYTNLENNDNWNNTSWTRGDPAVWKEINSKFQELYTIFLSDLSYDVNTLISKSPGLLEPTKFFRGGRINTIPQSEFDKAMFPFMINSAPNGIGYYEGVTSLTYDEQIAKYYEAMNGAINHITTAYVPAGIKGLYAHEDLLGDYYSNIYKSQQEYTIGGVHPYIELTDSHNAIRGPAEILALTGEQVAEINSEVNDILSDDGIRAKESGSGPRARTIPHQSGDYSSPYDADISDKWADMLQNVLVYFKEVKAMGVTWEHGPFSHNPQSVRFDNTEQISTFIHEQTHLLRNHWERHRLDSSNPDYMPRTYSSDSIGGYFTNHFDEWEAEYVEYHALKKLGMEPSKIAKERLDAHEQFLIDQGHTQYMHKDQLDEMVDFFVSNINSVVDYHDKFIYDISKYNKRNYEGYYEDNIATWKRTKDLIKDPKSVYTKILPGLSRFSWLENKEGYLEIGANDENIEQFKSWFHIMQQDYKAAHPRAKGDSKTVLKAHNMTEDKILKTYGILITKGERLLNIFNKEASEEAYSSGDVSFKKMLEMQQKYNTSYNETDLLKWGYHKQDKSAINYFKKIAKQKQKQVSAGSLSQQEYNQWESSIKNYIPDTQVNWQNYFKDMSITDTGKADNEFMHYINHVLPMLILEHIQQEAFGEHEIFGAIKEITDFGDNGAVPAKNMVKDAFETLSKDENGKYINPLYNSATESMNTNFDDFIKAYTEFFEMQQKVLEQMFKDATEQWNKQQELVDIQRKSQEEYLKFYKEQQKYTEELIGARTQADVNSAEEYSERIEAENPMFSSFNGYHDYIANNKYGRARHRIQNSAFFSDDAEFIKRTTFGFDENGNFVNKGKSYAKDKNGNILTNKRFRPRKWLQDKALNAIDWMEQTDYRVKSATDAKYKSTKEYAEKLGPNNNITKTANKFNEILQPVEEFNNALSGLTDIFPFLTPAVIGLTTALDVAGYGIQYLELMETLLTVARGESTIAAMAESDSTLVATAGHLLLTAATWAESESDLQATIGKWILIGATQLAAATEAILGAIRGFIAGPLFLPLLAILAAVVAAIKLIQFWEGKHAQALKDAQKALQEYTAKNNIAISQYKDLKKARENETDAIKRQQAARREAIALYELEASRIRKRKAVHDEAKIRNDSVWGEYGLRAEMQKVGLGFIAGGDFQSQYANYDGTTANIRQIKESGLGQVSTGDKAYVINTYDNNKMFFAEVEAYQDSLGELYDKESKLIEQYGSIDAARDTKEFREAVQEFADATGINGETAGKMLDWLETENRVNQATQAMKAQTRVIIAKADAKATEAELEGEPGLGDMDTLQQAMIMSQAQDIYKDAYDYMWWEKFQADLFGILWTIIDHLMVWDWTDHAEKYWKKSEAYQEGMEELSQLGVRGLSDIGDEMANGANRRDYGAGAIGRYHDTPFGGALESQDAMMGDYAALIELERKYASEETQKFHKDIRDGMNEAGEGGVEGFKKGLDQHSPGAISRSVGDEMVYTQQSIQKNSKGVYAYSNELGQGSVDSFKEGLGQNPEGNISKSTNEEMLYTQQAFEKNKEPIGKASYEVGYEAGEQYGQGFLDGLASLYAQVSTPEALAESLENKILVEQGYGTPKGADPNDPEVQRVQAQRRQETEAKLIARGFSLPSLSGFAKSEGKAAYRAAKSGGLRSWKDTSVIGRIANAAEIGITEGSASKGLKALFAPKYGEEFGVKGAKHAINKVLGRETGEAVAKAPTGKIVGTVDNALGAVGAKGSKYVEKGLSKLGIESGESLTEAGGKFVARHFGDDAAKMAVKGGSKLAKMGSKALPFVGTAITAATSIAEHNPFEKHYNEDGSEKRALQSSGEVAGEVAGALASDVVGVVAGPVAGMAAGLILEPIGEAIGGTIGWMADEVVNTKFTDAWSGFNDALGGIPGQIVGFIDESPIGQAGHAIWDGLDGLTGGWLGDTWENIKNSSIAELTGLDQLGGALQGVGEWLFGGGEENQEIPTPDQITDEQIMQLEQAGMLDEYMAKYGLDKEQQNVLGDKKMPKMPGSNSGSTIVIKNININTEDDPEKIKSALMNLIIEMQEQINPRQVSRTVGEPPQQSTDMSTDTNNQNQVEGVDPNNPNSTTTNNTQNNGNNNNPTT